MAKVPKCTVKFTMTSRGPSAVLDYRGHSLNVMNYPKGYAITRKEKSKARHRLLRGCAELVRDFQKASR